MSLIGVHDDPVPYLKLCLAHLLTQCIHCACNLKHKHTTHITTQTQGGLRLQPKPKHTGHIATQTQRSLKLQPKQNTWITLQHRLKGVSCCNTNTNTIYIIIVIIIIITIIRYTKTVTRDCTEYVFLCCKTLTHFSFVCREEEEEEENGGTGGN